MGPKYVNNPTLSDVTFLVEGRMHGLASFLYLSDFYVADIF